MEIDRRSKVDLSQETIGFIGGGNMARAIGGTLVKRGILTAHNVWVSTRTESSHKFWKELGVNTTLDNNKVATKCDTVVLAVKPQFLDTVIASLNGNNTVKTVISVIVGVSISTLERKLGEIFVNSCFIRTLPNTSLAVGAGMTVYCYNAAGHCRPGSRDISLVETVFSSLGVVEEIDESIMNAVSALSGSGPAYAYLITEALSDGAVKNGIPRALATRLAAQMLVGAGKMVLETGKHPGQLKDEVCSPGGTTIAGVHALEAGGVRVSLINAIDAAAKRADELFAK